jgi:hypothetical protein
MSPERNEMRAQESSIDRRRETWGNSSLNFCAVGLILSLLFKFSQLPGPIAYVASPGIRGWHILFYCRPGIDGCDCFFGFVPRDSLELLLVSYFGGAISAHWSTLVGAHHNKLIFLAQSAK